MSTPSAPNDATYLLIDSYSDDPTTGLPNQYILGSVLQGSSQIQVADAGNLFTIQPQPDSAFANLLSQPSIGYMVSLGSGQYASRTFSQGSGILITNADGVIGATSIAQNPSSVLQLINAQANGGSVTGGSSTINFVAGSNINVGVSGGGSGPIDVTISAIGGGTGTVTSVGLIEGDSDNTFTITGSPITSNGNITLSIANNALKLTKLASGGATTGQVLTWSGTNWIPETGSGGSGVTSLNNYSGDTSIQLSGNSGDVQIKLGSTLNGDYTFGGSITMDADIQMNGYGLAYTDYLGLEYDSAGHQLKLSSTQVSSPTKPNLQIADNTNIGNIYDSYFNPITASVLASTSGASTGYTLQLTGSSPDFGLAWAAGGGGGGGISSITSTNGSLVVSGTTTVNVDTKLPMNYYSDPLNTFIGGYSIPNYLQTATGTSNISNLFIVPGATFPSITTGTFTDNVIISSTIASLQGMASGAQNNTGLGSGVFNNLTTGTGNTAVGTNALINLTTGTNNTVVGFASTLSANVSNTIMLGVGIGGANQGGSGTNTALGNYIQLGANNNCIGITAATSTSNSITFGGSGSYQIGIGTNLSLGGNTNAYQVVLGDSISLSAGSSTGAFRYGQDSIAIGQGITSANQHNYQFVMIGGGQTLPNTSQSSGVNMIGLGYGACPTVDTRILNVSNSAVIGNIPTGSGTEYAPYQNTNFHVGIGTNTPYASLHLAGGPNWTNENVECVTIYFDQNPNSEDSSPSLPQWNTSASELPYPGAMLYTFSNYLQIINGASTNNQQMQGIIAVHSSTTSPITNATYLGTNAQGELVAAKSLATAKPTLGSTFTPELNTVYIVIGNETSLIQLPSAANVGDRLQFVGAQTDQWVVDVHDILTDQIIVFGIAGAHSITSQDGTGWVTFEFCCVANTGGISWLLSNSNGSYDYT